MIKKTEQCNYCGETHDIRHFGNIGQTGGTVSVK